MKNPIVCALASVLLSSPAFAAPGDYAYGPGHMFGGEGWGFMILGPIMMIAFVVAVVLVVALLFRWIAGSEKGPAKESDRALAVLRERFAKGEIDEAEFEARRRVLERE